MGATGTSTVDFGAFPGKSDASVAVTGQAGIVSGSIVEAWLFGSTADHSEDEHFVEPLVVFAGTIVVGTGFTIYVRNNNPIGEMPIPDFETSNDKTTLLTDQTKGWGLGTRISGQWKVAWAWN